MGNGFEQWALESAGRGEGTPRLTGAYNGTWCSVPFGAGIRSYVLWRIQRLRDFDATTGIDSRNLIRTLLNDTDCILMLTQSNQKAGLGIERVV